MTSMSQSPNAGTVLVVVGVALGVLGAVRSTWSP
jgi:hypothetical protein